MQIEAKTKLKTCEQCGGENPASRSTCGACGATLPKDTITKVVSQSYVYAGLGSRWWAYFIDGLIVCAISGILVPMFGIAQDILYIPQIIALFYFVGFWTWRGQTPGKMIQRIYIIKTDGSPIGLSRAILRYILYYVSGIILFTGFLWVIWDSRNQGLHDKIAGTYVVWLH